MCHQQEAGAIQGVQVGSWKGEGIPILCSLHKEGPPMVLSFDMGDQVLMTMSAREMVCRRLDRWLVMVSESA